MKASVISALLFGSLASALVLPDLMFEKRDTVTDDVVVTITSTTTIYLDPTAASAFFASQSAASLSAAEASTTSTTTTTSPSSTTTATSVAPPPTTTTPAVAPTPAVQAEQPPTTTPTTTPAPAYTPPPPAYTPPPAAPTTTTPDTPAPTPQAPVAAAAGGSKVSGTGDITFYELSAGQVSCGGYHSDSEFVVALPIGVMQQYNPGNSNNNPLCGKSISITYQGKTTQGTVVDSCGGCDSQSIDLSPSLFQAVAGDLGLGRVGGVSWSVAT